MGLLMEEKQTIVALGAGSITKRVYPDGLKDAIMSRMWLFILKRLMR